MFRANVAAAKVLLSNTIGIHKVDVLIPELSTIKAMPVSYHSIF